MIKVLIVTIGAAIAIAATFLGDNALSNAESKIAQLSSQKDHIKNGELNEVNDLSSASHADANAVYLHYLIMSVQKQLPSSEIYKLIALDESEAIQRSQRAAGFIGPNSQNPGQIPQRANKPRTIDPDTLRTLINSATSGSSVAFNSMRQVFQDAVHEYSGNILTQNSEADALDQKISLQESSVQRLRLWISLLQILGIIIALLKDVIPVAKPA